MRRSRSTCGICLATATWIRRIARSRRDGYGRTAPQNLAFNYHRSWADVVNEPKVGLTIRRRAQPHWRGRRYIPSGSPLGTVTSSTSMRADPPASTGAGWDSRRRALRRPPARSSNRTPLLSDALTYPGARTRSVRRRVLVAAAASSSSGARDITYNTYRLTTTANAVAWRSTRRCSSRSSTT